MSVKGIDVMLLAYLRGEGCGPLSGQVGNPYSQASPAANIVKTTVLRSLFTAFSFWIVKS